MDNYIRKYIHNPKLKFWVCDTRMDMTVDCKPNEAHNQVTGIIYMPLNIKFQFSVCKKNFTISLSTPNLTILGLENIT